MRYPTQLGSTTPKDGMPTSRTAVNQVTSVLAILREKAPRRALHPYEARQVAEWQAAALLDMGSIEHPPVPSALITNLPRIAVDSDADLPVSGCLRWRAGRWLILVNGSEPLVRQRFSVAHELKHAIDHRYAHLLYRDRPGNTAQAQAEQAADWFAACLLMPRPQVKQAWATGPQRVSELARRFQVSSQAMARRLAFIGLRPNWEKDPR